MVKYGILGAGTEKIGRTYPYTPNAMIRMFFKTITEARKYAVNTSCYWSQYVCESKDGGKSWTVIGEIKRYFRMKPNKGYIAYETAKGCWLLHLDGTLGKKI